MLLAIDLGTNALKAGLFELDGRPRIVVRRPYPLCRVGENGAEQDPEDWWRAACDALGEISSAHNTHNVAALCVIGQGPSLVVTDTQLRARSPALIWADRRSEPERLSLSERFGYEVSVWSLLSKISWLRRERPDAFGGDACVLQAYDFVAARMAGRPFASQYGGYPPFSAEEFARVGLEPRIIPPTIPLGRKVGATRAPWCEEAHLPEGIPVIAGVYDAIATTLGAGVIEQGRACDYGGNSGGYGLCWPASLHAKGVDAWPGLLPEQYILGGATANAGSSIEWFARTFGGVERLTENVEEAAAVSAGADGLTFLPYLLGERAPLWDDDLRGAFVGLSLHHRYPHLLRAVLEGVAFGLRILADAVKEAGGRLQELIVSGGTARYDLLNRIKADVLGAPVLEPEVLDASLLGAAMLAALGRGLRRDYTEAVGSMVHVARRLEPDARIGSQYDEAYARFRQLTAMRLH